MGKSMDTSEIQTLYRNPKELKDYSFREVVALDKFADKAGEQKMIGGTTYSRKMNVTKDHPWPVGSKLPSELDTAIMIGGRELFSMSAVMVSICGIGWVSTRLASTLYKPPAATASAMDTFFMLYLQSLIPLIDLVASLYSCHPVNFQVIAIILHEACNPFLLFI